MCLFFYWLDGIGGGGNLIFFPVSLSFATRAAVMLKRSSKVDDKKCKNLLQQK